jgi:outer membrane lipoprotein-sorting protein
MKKIFSLLFLVVVFLSSCQRQPSADFTTDKYNYIAGDVVILTNTSIDGSKFKWTLPDGQTSGAENLDYNLSETQQDATLTFTLEAISNNGKKSDVATKLVSVKSATGQATIWTSNSNVNPISVYIDNISAGTITASYFGTPNCGALGCVTATLKVGTHYVSASDGNYTWSGTVNVIRNGCSTLVLQ